MTTMLAHPKTPSHKNNLNHHHHNLLLPRTPPSLPLTDYPNYGGDDDHDDVIINPSSPSPDTGPPEKKSRICGPLTQKLCTHCEVHETPQWRVGPNGPSTLCNACGLSYLRMGHLLPAYRPVRSPSFSPQLHFNFYTRKKMMMMVVSGQTDSEMSPDPVSSVENLALAHRVPNYRNSDHPVPSSGNLDHPFSSSEKYNISAFTTQHPSSSGSTNVAEANEQQKSWYIKQDNDALYLKVDMAGVRKRDVKISVKGTTLKVKGVRKLDPHFRDEEKCLNTYIAKVGLLERNEYNVDGIKAGLKHGVLKVIVPKLSRDVFCT